MNKMINPNNHWKFEFIEKIFQFINLFIIDIKFNEHT